MASAAAEMVGTDTLEQAAEWYALLRGGAADEADRRAWSEWLSARAEHRQAWQQVERISRSFEPLREPGLQGAAAAAVRQTRGERGGAVRGSRAVRRSAGWRPSAAPRCWAGRPCATAA